jgi:type I restriction enzyme S subunit
LSSIRIKHVAHINRTVLPEDTDPDYKFRYIDIGAVDDLGNVSIPKEAVAFAAAPTRARRLAPAGAAIVSTVRTYLRAIAVVPKSEDPLVFSTGFAVLEAGPQLDGRFLSYYCRSQPFVDEVVARSVGVSYPAINASEIGDIPVALPALEEQRRIADFLDAETARIDRMVRAREAQLVGLEERSFAAVTEALIPASLERPLGTFPYPWLPELPADAPLTRLGYVCRLQNGITVDENRAPTAKDVTRPYLRVANVQAGHIALDSVTEITVPRHMARRSTLRVGDVLMTEGGDLDKLGRGTVWHGELTDCLHQNHVFALRPDPEKLDADYLAFMTQTLHGRCYFESTGTKTTNLASTNSSKILSFPIPLPSVERQRELVNEVRAQQAANLRMQRSLTRQVSLLCERRQTLITAAVTGQVDVSTARGVDAA